MFPAHLAVQLQSGVPLPMILCWYDFAVSEQEVKEYQGIMHQQPSVKDPTERERQLAREVKDALADEVVDGLRKLGFTIERVSRGTAPTGNELLVDGQFLTVDEGNPLHRLVIGFGTGTSMVESRAQVYHREMSTVFALGCWQGENALAMLWHRTITHTQSAFDVDDVGSVKVIPIR